MLIKSCEHFYLLLMHGDYSADIRVMQDYSADPRVVQDSHSDYSADPKVLQYSADPRVV